MAKTDPNSEPDKNETEDKSALGKLSKDLYSREESDEIQLRRKALGELGRRELASGMENTKETRGILVNVLAERSRRWRRIAFGGAIVLVAGLVVAGAVWGTMRYRASRQVTSEHAALTVSAPAEFIAGEELAYAVSVQNTSKVDWQDVEVVLTPPEGWEFIESDKAQLQGRVVVIKAPDLAAGQTTAFSARGRLVAEEGATVGAEAEVVLTPKNFPSGRFSHKARASSRVQAMPIDVSVEAAPEAAHGERMVALLHVRNLSNRPVEGLVLKLNPSPGIQLAVEDNQFSAEFSPLQSSWSLPPIESLGSVSRTAVLVVEGLAGEVRTLEVEAAIEKNGKIFAQRRVAQVIRMSTSELTVEQTFAGLDTAKAVRTGQKIRGEVKYHNVGALGLRNAVVQVHFEGEGLDASKLVLKTGAYDPTTQTITWSSASVPELALLQPGEEGILAYDFAILPLEKLPLPPAGQEGSQNLALITTAIIDSQDLPTPAGQERRVVSDRVVLSVATDILLGVDAFYDDGRLGLKSAGPVPPRVGETTTYTIRLRLGSALNEVGDVRVMAVLPDSVGYTGRTFLTVGSVNFDQASRQIRWDIPLLKALTSRALPAEELHFQISLTPGENLRDQKVPLLLKLTAEGVDQFTDQAVQQQVLKLPTTEEAAPGKGKVQ